MKVVQIDAYGGPENMVMRDVGTPEPGSGEALVRLEYAGVNYTDVYNRNGLYAKSHTYANAPPFTLGREGGGVVERIGPDVDSVAAGDRVAWCIPLGSYAEAAVVPAWRLVNFGAASGAVESIEPLALAEAGSIFFTRPHMADYMRDAGEIAWRGRSMFEHHAAGRVAATIDRILPLGAAAEAHRMLEARETRGKLLLKIG